jgi:hypothetical protein
MKVWPFKKKHGRVVMLFQDPVVAREMARRISEKSKKGAK